MSTVTFPWWGWLFPVTYAFHILEEVHAGEGFYAWIRYAINRQIGYWQFYAANLILLLAMVGASALIPAGSPTVWLIAILGSLVTVNGLGHLLGTMIIRVYSPGLVTGLVFWVPLGIYAMTWARTKASLGLWLFGLSVGVVLMACVGLLGLILSRPSIHNR